MKRNEFLGMFAVLPFIMLDNKQENNNKQDTEFTSKTVNGISVKCIKIDDKPVDMRLFINVVFVDNRGDVIILQSDSGWRNITKKYNGYTMDDREKHEGRESLIDWIQVYND